jgi:transposase
VKALSGNLRGHHGLIIEQLLADIAVFVAQIAELDLYMESFCAKKTIISIGLMALRASIGDWLRSSLPKQAPTWTDFLTSTTLLPGSDLCPGQNQSAGKRKSAKIRKGNRALRAALVEVAHGAIRKKESYFGAQYRRIASKRGKKKAIIAVAHSLAIAVYHILKSKTAYRELGANFFDTINPLKALHRLTKRIESLGYNVSVTVADTAA